MAVSVHRSIITQGSLFRIRRFPGNLRILARDLLVVQGHHLPARFGRVDSSGSPPHLLTGCIKEDEGRRELAFELLYQRAAFFVIAVPLEKVHFLSPFFLQSIHDGLGLKASQSIIRIEFQHNRPAWRHQRQFRFRGGQRLLSGLKQEENGR